MSNQSRARIVEAPVVDVFAVAAEAVAAGTAADSDWETLAAWCKARGMGVVTRALAERSGSGGPSEAWWRCNILLNSERSLNEALRLCCDLVELELGGYGPAFDVDRHALEVSWAVRYLEQHLERLRAGSVTRGEWHAAAVVAQVARVARRWGR